MILLTPEAAYLQGIKQKLTFIGLLLCLVTFCQSGPLEQSASMPAELSIVELDNVNTDDPNSSVILVDELFSISSDLTRTLVWQPHPSALCQGLSQQHCIRAPPESIS